ncbi:prepilin-type N-terminal cleavage/methylation domain-containing protein [Sulfurimonas sp.]|jgi:general secretion pathway protein G|uniref:prepilin-type N-terminal cleavage/methylation domain-containing protein n=1 Tax=Sulfurimonas sp. TaxID=2022749 RepID=UPI002A36C34F|nr:prepilin-type N-terminal cleavage/methylation domain-containing protein [Sulfurimonas sp.]MDY0124006.1 prepilin-type N-terminal cleavage/methylation domain-containing protein [Sulfurimonas sp.]
MKFSRAFTVIELIFVIVVLGILATVALPKFGATREVADIAKGRGDVATIRTAIANERQTQVIKGNTSYINKLSSSSTTLFTGDTSVTPNRTLLTYGIKAGAGSGDWTKNSDTEYVFTVGSSVNTFTYTPSDGKFLCTSGTECSALQD